MMTQGFRPAPPSPTDFQQGWGLAFDQLQDLLRHKSH